MLDFMLDIKLTNDYVVHSTPLRPKYGEFIYKDGRDVEFMSAEEYSKLPHKGDRRRRCVLKRTGIYVLDLALAIRALYCPSESIHGFCDGQCPYLKFFLNCVNIDEIRNNIPNNYYSEYYTIDHFITLDNVDSIYEKWKAAQP